MSAVILLQEDLLGRTVDGGDKEESKDTKDSKDQPNKDRIGVLAIAYHNMGVEQEFLRSVSH